MDTKTIVALAAVVAVAVIGLLMRRGSRSATPRTPAPPDPGPDMDESVLDVLEEFEQGETVAMTSDGWAFMPIGDRDKVQLVPPSQPAMDELPGRGSNAPEQWNRGELIAARVRRGAPDHDPWVVEGLGRDQEYRAWRFETEEAARAALDLLTRRVVRTPDGDDGPMRIGDAEFDEARRRDQEIEAELAAMPEDGEGTSRPPL